VTIFGIGLGSAIAIYFIIWWLSLFVVLPWRVKTQQDQGNVAQGTDPGAPAVSHIGLKMAVTSVVAAVFFALFIALMHSGLTLDMFPGPAQHHYG